MQRFLIVVLVCFVAGCGKNDAPTPQPAIEPPRPGSESAIVDPPKVKPTPAVEPPKEAANEKRLREFREKVAHYLSEARAGAKLLSLAPSLAQARKKSEEITDLYTRLPDVPVEIKQHELLATRLKNINGSFFAAKTILEIDSKADAETAKIANDVRGICTEIEGLMAK